MRFNRLTEFGLLINASTFESLLFLYVVIEKFLAVNLKPSIRLCNTVQRRNYVQDAV